MGGRDLRATLGSRVERDDSAGFGEAVQLVDEHVGGHHPAGDENECILSGACLRIMKFNTIGADEFPALDGSGEPGAGVGGED